jgi:hypothetical protein
VSGCVIIAVRQLCPLDNCARSTTAANSLCVGFVLSLGVWVSHIDDAKTLDQTHGYHQRRYDLAAQPVNVGSLPRDLQNLAFLGTRKRPKHDLIVSVIHV